MNRATKMEAVAIITTLLAVYLSVSTLDYRDALEQENADLKTQVKKLRTQVADPPKLCQEYYRKLMRGK